MRKFLPLLLLASSAWGVTVIPTPVGQTNVTMTENIPGVDPNGNSCYLFQTIPSCAVTFQALGGGGTQCLQVNNAGVISGTGASCGGAGASPGGPFNAVQFNNAGAFGGVGNFNWSGSSLTVGGNLLTTGTFTSQGTITGNTNATVTGTVNTQSKYLIETVPFVWDGGGGVSGTSVYIGQNSGQNQSGLIFQATCVGGNSCTAVTNTAARLSAFGAFSSTGATGADNTCLGYGTCEVMTSAAQNTCVGSQACGNVTTNAGGQNVAVGYLAEPRVTIGGADVCVGTDCFDMLTTGNNNVGVGNTVMGDMTTGSWNTCMGNNSPTTGVQACSGLTTGVHNTEIGAGASGVTSASSNTLVGAGANMGGTPIQESICIGFKCSVNTNNTARIGGAGADSVHMIFNSTVSVVSNPTSVYDFYAATNSAGTAGTLEHLSISTQGVIVIGGLTSSPVQVNAAHQLVGQAISLSSAVTGNLPVTNLNSGTNADSSHFWRGDGQWISSASFLTGNQTITLSGDSTGSGATAITVTAAATQGNITTFTHSITMTSSLTVTGAGGITDTFGVKAATAQFTSLGTNTNVCTDGSSDLVTSGCNNGTITGITAGTGLSGGGTSGNVTLNLVTPVVIANGGTNATSFTANTLTWFNGTSIVSDTHTVITTSSETFNSPFGVTVSFNLNIGSMTGAGLTTCGDSSHAIAWNVNGDSKFTCQSITGSASAGGSPRQYQFNLGGALAGDANFQSFASSQVYTGALSSFTFVTASSMIITSPLASQTTALTLINTDVNSLVDTLVIQNAGGQNAMQIIQTGNVSKSFINGGALNIVNGPNPAAPTAHGALMVLYSSDTAPIDNLVNIRTEPTVIFSSNIVFVSGVSSQPLVTISFVGTTGEPTTGGALNVTSVNPNFSAMSLSGTEGAPDGFGTLKITHTAPNNLSDSNAAALSIQLTGNPTSSTTSAQGIFVKSTAANGTTGSLFQLRNPNIERFIVGQFGETGISASTSSAYMIVFSTTANVPTVPLTGAGNGWSIAISTNGEFVLSGTTGTANVQAVLSGGAGAPIKWGNVITGVTAGTGLTGGGTSGAITVSLATPVSIANGGTNGTSFTNNTLTWFNGTSIVSDTNTVITTSSETFTSPQGVKVQFGLNIGSMTGAGLATCGDATHGLGFNASNQFTCQNITGSGGGGASTLAVTTGSVNGFVGPPISSPTAVIIADTNTLAGQLLANSTFFLQLAISINQVETFLSSVTFNNQTLHKSTATFNALAKFNNGIALSTASSSGSAGIVNANYTTQSQDTVILASATAAGITITVNYSSNSPMGQVIDIIKVSNDTFTITVVSTGVDLLDGSTKQIFLNAVGQTDEFINAGILNGSGTWMAHGIGIEQTPRYIAFSPGAIASSGGVGTSSNTYIMAFDVTVPVVVKELDEVVNTQSGNVDLGIYDNKGTLLGHTGATAVATPGLQTITLSPFITLAPGLYYLAIYANNTTALFGRCSTYNNTPGCMSYSNAGATQLQSSITIGGGTLGNQCFCVWGKVAGGVTF